MKAKKTHQRMILLMSGLLFAVGWIAEVCGDDSVNSAVVTECDTTAEILSAVQSLNELEKDSILYMREEEKLARDVYMKMEEVWGSQIFTNIKASEQVHMDVIKLLIDRFNLEDPVDEYETPGVFTEASGFGELYDMLVALGSDSVELALSVGVIIEELDIDDLEMYLASEDPSIVKPAIRQVYEHLVAASWQHWSAFTTKLD